jgi:acyl-coenzyme A synthetase/AMP-(fatty) acid ligase
VVLQEARAELTPGPEAEALAREIQKAVTREHGLSPNQILLLPPGSLPKTSSGKIRRSASRKLFLEGALSPIAQWERPARSVP